MFGNKVVKSFSFVAALSLLLALSIFFLVSPKSDSVSPGKVAFADNNGGKVATAAPAPEITIPASTVAPATSAASATTATTAAPEIVATLATTPRPSKAKPVAESATPEELSRLRQTWLGGIPVTIYVPESLQVGQTTQLVIALHGMSGQGGVICKGLVNFAEQTGVVLMAPTFNYNPNYADPNTVAGEDVNLTAKLNEMMADLEPITGTHFKKQVMLYGFSRGAQLAHRFALLYPDRTLAVAALSAGSYTLPYKTYAGKDNKVMPFPFGVGDLKNYTSKAFDPVAFRKIHFMIEVGEEDNDPNQAPRAWDSIGKSRAERANTFYQTLKQLGLDAQVKFFPNTGHQESSQMRESALNFFKGVLAA